MILYKNIKLMFCLSYGGTDFFDTVAGVLQGNTQRPFLFIICLDYEL